MGGVKSHLEDFVAVARSLLSARMLRSFEIIYPRSEVLSRFSKGLHPKVVGVEVGTRPKMRYWSGHARIRNAVGAQRPQVHDSVRFKASDGEYWRRFWRCEELGGYSCQ